MAIEIITDSTSDLTAQEARERNVHLIPMRVIFEDGVYQDGVDLDKDNEVLFTAVTPAEVRRLAREILAQGNRYTAVFTQE